MIAIIISILLSVSIVIRSFEGFVTNKKILKKVNHIHLKGRKYIKKITKSSYKTASEGILLVSVQYLIYFWVATYFLSMLVFGIVIKIKETNNTLIINEFNTIIISLLILLSVKFGLKYDFTKFKSLIKKEILKILKSPITWGIFLLLYIIIFATIFFFIELYKVKLNISYHQIFNEIQKEAQYEMVLFSLYPFIILAGVLIAIMLLYLLVWLLSKSISYISYFLFKKTLLFCLILNKKHPLKPLFILVQISIIIFTPIIAFAIKILQK